MTLSTRGWTARRRVRVHFRQAIRDLSHVGRPASGSPRAPGQVGTTRG